MRYAPRRKQSRLSPMLVIALLTLGALGPVAVPPSHAATQVGFRDFSFGASVSSPTAEKPQSKLWFTDGLWWGSLYNASAGEYRIYRLDWGTQTWSDTGTRVDTREAARMDTLWDGTHLYIGSAGTDSTNTNHSARVMRYSYDFATKSYILDAGFPVTLVSGGMQALVIDKDSTGKVWATYVRGTNVYVTHTTTDDRTWLAPYVIPVSGATNLVDALDGDMSALVAFDPATTEPKVGVMWSNQNDDAMYFATHIDGRPDSEWQVEPALQAPGYADDHLNLKSLQTDASGRVFAATKTSLTASEAPLILLLVKGTDGGWRRHTVARVKEDHTRPIVLIDQQNRNLYVFMSSPCCSGGVIYYKHAPLDNISFAEGMGTPFIQTSTDLKINNVTSTKQTLNSATGLVVMASDNGSDYYLHNFMDFSSGSDTTPPDTTIDRGPSGIVNNSSASFEFSSNEAGSSFECSLDAGAFSACTSPKEYTGLADGSHTFHVRAKDAAGNTDATPAERTWTVDATAPDTTIDIEPSNPSNDTSPSFTFSSSETGSAFECSLDESAFVACTSPKEYADLVEGKHTFQVRAIDPVGNTDATPASYTWTVDTTAPAVAITEPSDGATVSRTVKVKASASDGSGVMEVRFYLDGKLLGTDESAPYEISWNTKKSANGQYALYAVAVDSAGNTTKSTSISVTVRN